MTPQLGLLCAPGACRHREPGLLFPATKKVEKKKKRQISDENLFVLQQHLSNLTDKEFFQELKNNVIRKLSAGDFERKQKDCKCKLYHTGSVVASEKRALQLALS